MHNKERIMTRSIMAVVLVTVIGAPCSFAQAVVEPRRIDEEHRPIVERLRPDDRHVILVSATTEPAWGDPGDRFVEEIVNTNPVIVVGRIVEKRPVFLNLRMRRRYTFASLDQANWIGSRLTLLVDRVIQTIDELPLAPGERLTFVEDGDGSAVINGVRVDAETPWLWPVEMGRRYLITGRLETNRFVATGMWMEPPAGGNMRANVTRARSGRTPGELGPFRSPVASPFDDWSIEEASFFLEQEIQRRGAGRR